MRIAQIVFFYTLRIRTDAGTNTATRSPLPEQNVAGANNFCDNKVDDEDDRLYVWHNAVSFALGERSSGLTIVMVVPSTHTWSSISTSSSPRRCTRARGVRMCVLVDDDSS